LGLDWNPGNRPRPGFEAEFDRLFAGISEKRIQAGTPEHARFFEISISAYETLQAPQVGSDARADEWIRAKYREQQPQMTEAEWIDRFQGFYVVELVPACDGIPAYSNGSPGGYVEPFSFRAQFLRDCESIISTNMLEAAYVSKRHDETTAYGHELISIGEAFAQRNGLDPRNCSASDDDLHGETPRYFADIILSAGKWCVFWGEQGHTLDAYW
jgi:hypothetical protein